MVIFNKNGWINKKINNNKKKKEIKALILDNYDNNFCDSRNGDGIPYLDDYTDLNEYFKDLFDYNVEKIEEGVINTLNLIQFMS